MMNWKNKVKNNNENSNFCCETNLSCFEEKNIFEKILIKVKKFQTYDGYEYFFKGVVLEVFLNDCLKEMNFSKNKINWNPGSHGIGRDLCNLSVKSFRPDKKKLKFSGSRTQARPSLSEKIDLLKYPNFEKFLLVGLGKETLKIIFLSADIFKNVDESCWLKKNKDFVTKGSLNGFDIKISASTSSQFWFSCKNIDNIPPEYISIYEGNI